MSVAGLPSNTPIEVTLGYGNVLSIAVAHIADDGTALEVPVQIQDDISEYLFTTAKEGSYVIGVIRPPSETNRVSAKVCYLPATTNQH